jgi:hypothetical protein
VVVVVAALEAAEVAEASAAVEDAVSVAAVFPGQQLDRAFRIWVPADLR